MQLQGTDAWFAARLGKVTASRVSDVVARVKTGYGASRANYMAQLIVERLTGLPMESYENDAMRWGKQQEGPACLAYEFLNNATVEPAGFVPHPLIANAGASPDGYLGDHGLVEIKAPNTATHIETLLTEKVDSKYFLQMQFQMACTGRDFCDFVSFDPRLPPSMQLWCERVERNAMLIDELEAEVRLFLAELEARVEALKRRYELEAAA